MGGGIFVTHDDREFFELTEKPYVSEKHLQDFIAKHPNLLAGDQIDPVNPRRWLLVSREFHVSSDESDVGWLDHLFLDQDGIPTLIEVKRSSDTRIRREVVGQLLDYAANAVVHLPVEIIRSKLEIRCEKEGLTADKELGELLGTEGDLETFWTQVQDNLRVGRVRLVFVADVIPVELRRIVEFLNVQMSPAEVLAVEIRQYVGEGIRSLVPRIFGQTTEAQRKKGGQRPPTRQWDEVSFFSKLQGKFSSAEVDAVRRILDWISARVTRVWWGQGATIGSFVPVLHHHGTDHLLFAVFTSGGVGIYFQWYQYRPVFDSPEKRLELLARLNKIPGVSWPEDVITRRPSIPFLVLTDKAALQQFFATFEWMISEIQTGDPVLPIAH